MIERRHLTLLEMLIAMTMTIVILMALSMFYQNAAHVGLELDRMKAENFSLRYLENRLMHILPRAGKAGKGEDPLFFSLKNDSFSAPGSQSLIFLFDNGDVLDKIFSNELVARLFVNKEHELILAYWPPPKRLGHVSGQPADAAPMKKEVLMDHVEWLHLEFYVAPHKEQESEKKQKEGAEKSETSSLETPTQQLRSGWHRMVWQQEYKQLPDLIRLQIKRAAEQQPLQFIIPLPHSQGRILYQGST
jgi:hypothetical protein